MRRGGYRKCCHHTLELQHVWQTQQLFLKFSSSCKADGFLGLAWMMFLIVKSWHNMEVCSRSQNQHMKMIFDRRFLFWQRVHKGCGCHWTNRVVSMMYKFTRPWTDIEDQNLTKNCNRGDTLYRILDATGSQCSECKMAEIAGVEDTLLVELWLFAWGKLIHNVK